MTAHKYFAYSSLLCMGMSIYSGHKLVSPKKKKSLNQIIVRIVKQKFPFFIFILLALRDRYDFEYGTDKEVDGAVINDKCKTLAQKVKEIIDTKSSFADWLNNQNVRNQLKLEIKICLIKTAILHSTAPKFSKRSWSKSRTLRRTIKSSIKKKYSYIQASH